MATPAEFWQVYEARLAVKVAESPAQYALRPDEHPQDYARRVAVKMRAAVEVPAPANFGRVSYDTPAFRYAARYCDVRPTRAGLNSIYGVAQ